MAELSDKSSDALRHGRISDIGHLLYIGSFAGAAGRL